MRSGWISQIIKMKKQQEAFERVNFYEFKKEIFTAEHLKVLKERGELLVGCLKPSLIYKLTYDKTDQTFEIETFRGHINQTAAFAGWTHENLMHYMCGGVVYEEDLLVVKRRPEEEIIALEKAYKRKVLKNNLVLLALFLMMAIPAFLGFIQILKPK